MVPVLLLGAGKIGSTMAKLLSASDDYDVLVCDVDQGALERIAALGKIKTAKVDVSHGPSIRKLMKGRRVAISACTFSLNPTIAAEAAAAGCSYFDLTEDVETTKLVRRIAKDAGSGQVFMPQCGLAPGFVSIAAYELARKFDKLDEVRMRVGALPQFPTNELKYNLTWSTDGLINEYGNPCEAIYKGEFIKTLPLEGLEHFSLDGIDYEAFNTSGGVGTLCETLRGKLRTLDYKTIRYRGHRELIAFLMNELRLNDRRDLLKDIFENAVPMTPQDVVLIFCTVTGWKDGRLTQLTDARKIYHGNCLGEDWGAIQITTAAGACAAVDIMMNRPKPRSGFVKQEEISLPEFLKNRFGKYYQAMPQETGTRAPVLVRN